MNSPGCRGFVGEGPDDEGLNGARNGIPLVLHSMEFATLNKTTGVWEPDLDAYEFFGVTPPASQKVDEMITVKNAKERKAFWLLLGVNLIVWARVGLVLLEMVK